MEYEVFFGYSGKIEATLTFYNVNCPNFCKFGFYLDFPLSLNFSEVSKCSFEVFLSSLTLQV